MIRIGKINYTNILPIYYYFDEQRFVNQLKMIPQVPSQLNQQMKEGNIDLGPISSFAYAENDGAYYILPDLSVSSKGKVRSIFLFSKKPIEELSGSAIALTSSSATSVALLKIILEKFIQVKVTYHTMSPSLDEMMKEHDAALLIGDDALLASLGNQSYPYVYDLGEEWHKWTDKYMTFAVWAVRKEVIEENGELLTNIYHAFQESKQKGKKDLKPLVEELCSSFGGNPLFWDQYFSGLSYDFNEQHKEGLEYFYQLAHELDLLPQQSRVRMWEPNCVFF